MRRYCCLLVKKINSYAQPIVLHFHLDVFRHYGMLFNAMVCPLSYKNRAPWTIFSMVECTKSRMKLACAVNIPKTVEYCSS
jgi:hypothetical protein